MAVYNEHREVPPQEWALQTAYPWLAAFSSDEAGEFALPSSVQNLEQVPVVVKLIC
jgi:hypothetical protein